ncbi:MAG: metallophosphoesterase family protein [Bacillota bacterium]|jgi:DNA repair exonuclease SbcCD nuclease subunit|uniref:metallophosphoesterase family protein n=1 Tax=Cytobacillus firmus TaxID=1399 RepID=UPI00064EEC55|nr:DNA repair exonuclease [Cytobacillus firmus]KML39518.1 DNA repair exonuclease [Cytobacillus firmus]MCS0651757.1 DNA repair exonuclease [Cytobacillus firmus]MCU1805036.1 DNA repair exonuclease [Cytobacillus firmus]WHY35376.1 DNA repair exonuclease [Cytobacillus firmus]
MKRVTFIHTADLHLDSPMSGLRHLPPAIFKKLQESTFNAFTKIIDLAIFHAVDFVILAGDLFDGEDRSIKAQTRFRKEMERLDERGIAVYAVHGNHDHMDGRWAHLPMPDNVHIFSHEVEVVKHTAENGTSVHLYGFSYPKRHVLERMIDQYNREDGADLHIGILHGSFEGSSDHVPYAPFRINDLLGKDFDYWALGHIHKREIIISQPPVIYPGNIQGRNRKETGPKGCYLVELDSSGAKMEFLEAAPVIWEKAEIDASGLENYQDVYDICLNLMEEKRQNRRGTILNLTLTETGIPDHELRSITNGELLETLQEEEADEESFVWISGITVNEKRMWNKENLAHESDFFSELFKTADQFAERSESALPLYSHPLARRFMNELTKDEKQRIAEEAEALLVDLLYKA